MNVSAPLAPPGTRACAWCAALAAGLLLALAGIAFGALALQRARAPVFHGMTLDAGEPVSGLAFAGENGPVSIESFRGKPLVLFFGYTNCPDVCPTTLSDLSRAVKSLGAQADAVQVAMVSVDPERDSPQRVANYARAFHPSFAGLSGDAEQIAQAAMQFGVHYARTGEAAQSAVGYAMEHTASVMVLDAEGRLRLIFPFGMSNADIAEDLRALIGS
jgi:protein SCO1